MSIATATANANAVPTKWDATKIASQKGKRVIITGANSGIGFYTALELARHGADVVLACRSEEKGNDAVHKIQQELELSPEEAGSVEYRKLDVSSLASVQQFVDGFKQSNNRLDVLVNNAGIMAVPYMVTAEGFESQFATNHLGHFALTAHLFGQLKQSERARVVNVSSIAHRDAEMDPNEIIMSKESYRAFPMYRNTKVFNLLFTYELTRRLHAHGITNVISTAAHPGFTYTNLGTTYYENANWFMRQFINLLVSLPIIQSPAWGALPTLYAATAPGVQSSDYYGPDGIHHLTGYPTKHESENVSNSELYAKALWDESERLAKLSFPF